MTKNLIQIKNLSKIYQLGQVKTTAIKQISFSVKYGEFISIMGPSGSGKSTLMQILGLLDRPTTGQYLLNGENVNDFSENQLAKIRNKEIGFVFQTFNLLPRTTVYENVELPLLYDHNTDNHLNKEKIEQALKAVKMEHRLNHFSNQLSGGEKQRVAIARALVMNPNIILADEPTGNLDSKNGLQIMHILQKLNQHGKTVILVTHETYTAEHAQRILHFKDGQIINDIAVTKTRKADQETTLK
jgi:putative ABC transport system ATP-binding protein